MEAPEYLDLDEIDFSDDLTYSVTSLKNIPELCRRSDSQGEERQVPAINWSRGNSSHGGNGIKPSGIADAHSKFRPVKRVSPLKHQPEVPDPEADNKSGDGDGGKEDSSEKISQASMSSREEQEGKAKGLAVGPLFGELEHYDLDMDEILDVPYIKSSQQMSTLPRVAAERRTLGCGVNEHSHGVRTSTLPHSETLGVVAQYCVLSPTKCPEMHRSKSMETEYLRQSGSGQASDTLTGTLTCSSTSDVEKLLPARPYLEPRVNKSSSGMPGGQPGMFPVPAGVGSRGTTRGHGECEEDTKKAQNVISIVRGGQISLLPHLAADNLELIRDDEGNNLLHISAGNGHAELLQHLTSLMGEDCLNERNREQLTPAGLGIKNGHLECVRWMVSETEAIAELSCSRDHPSLIHYAARYGQEKSLLWLLQFMQEQAISLDEVDQHGNSAVHVAARYGHLGCIQTLVEYGSNVTIQNMQGERPAQTAEHHGHVTCSRYLVVVETCMSLASQVVKLTKQLNEQALERVSLQSQVQQLLGCSPSRSPSSLLPPAVPWPEMALTAEAVACDGQWVVRQRDVDSDSVLRQLLGKEIAEKVCPQERLSLEFRNCSREAPGGTPRRPGAGLMVQRDLKLARLKQLMQRSLSESDSDTYPPEEQRQDGVTGRPERPQQLHLTESVEPTAGLLLTARRHVSAAERKFSFGLGSSRSMDGCNPSPTSDSSDPDRDLKQEMSSDTHDLTDSQKVTTSPKSALKSPSSRRKTSQNLKLRVTFDEPVAHKEVQDSEAKSREGERVGARTSSSSDSGEVWKRPFGTFRSIMESFSSSQSSSQASCVAKHSSAAPAQGSPGRKSSDAKANPGSLCKSKNKASAV